MSRLIDADVLIERKFFIYDTEDLTHEEFENLVNKQPTAYDSEKVVEEIKRQSVCTNGCLTIGEDEAIDIVKAGGVE